MPILRPFRALRYRAPASELSALLCPPYDIISPTERQVLLDQDPHNAVRIELPGEVGKGGPEAYRQAARTVAEWRSDGVLMKDREPTITMHRMTWGDAEGTRQTCSGVFARLRLEPFGRGSGILPHERTMSGPKDDRYQLLRATGINTSPVVFLAGTRDATATAAMAELTARLPDATATTGDRVGHEVWVCPAEDEPRPEGPETAVRMLLDLLASAPLTIADGHHRYETALRYRDERGQNRACESDPAWDYVLALVYPLDGSPPALPTHRVLADGPTGDALLAALGGLFRVETLTDDDSLLARMAQRVEISGGATGTGRIGLLTGDRAAILSVDREEIGARLGSGLSEASRGLDVNALGVAIEHVMGSDAGTLADIGRLSYVKDAAAATELVTKGQAASCFLLDRMPASAIARVAAAGEVMPHKSTYFHPKAPTGLLFGPLEW